MVMLVAVTVPMAVPVMEMALVARMRVVMLVPVKRQRPLRP
jgi:hypothetical protein